MRSTCYYEIHRFLLRVIPLRALNIVPNKSILILRFTLIHNRRTYNSLTNWHLVFLSFLLFNLLLSLPPLTVSYKYIYTLNILLDYPTCQQQVLLLMQQHTSMTWKVQKKEVFVSRKLVGDRLSLNALLLNFNDYHIIIKLLILNNTIIVWGLFDM